MLDIIIKNGSIIDGSGKPAFQADLGILGGRIEIIGALGGAPAGEIVDATGLHISPGFIDMHCHSDLSLIEDPRGESKVRQGVTTELVGQCGFSPFPLTGKHPAIPRSKMETTYTARIDDVDWTDLAGYTKRVNGQGCAINIAPLVGHATIRAAAMGYEDRPPDTDEMNMMRRLVSNALDQGAFGLSTGLTLVPSSYADTEEIRSLAEIVAQAGGIYDTHGRFWSGGHFSAAEEAVDIGRRSGIRVQIAHLAIIDPRYQGQAEQLAGILDRAYDDGIDVAFDVYPYVAAGSMLSQMLPGWVQEGGVTTMVARLRHAETRRLILDELAGGWFRGLPWSWDKMFVASAGDEGDPLWSGKHIQQLSEEWSLAPAEAFLRLIDVSEDGVSAIMFNRTESDMQFFLRHRLSTIGSDGNAICAQGRHAGTMVHPRFYGTFPRILGTYVRELNVFTLEEAVHKMTARPAQRLGLRHRGLIQPGFVADLTLFDAKEVADRATFEQPHRYAVGIPHVMVAGQWVLRQGVRTDALPAQVLHRE